MMKEKLFEAIGGLDEKLLAEAENINTVRSGRVLRRTLLVAALVAGLAVTAAAAPRIRNALHSGSIQTDDTPYFAPTNPLTGECYQLRRHEITLEVDFDGKPTKRIDTYYMLPSLSEEFTQYHGYIYRDACIAQFGWIEEGKNRLIHFTQQAGGTVTPEDLTVDVYTAPEGVPEHGLRTLAGIQGYYVEVPPYEEEYGKKEFYWSDGQYLFCLLVPIDFTDAELEQMLSLVRPVEDITPYLYSMTDEEVVDAFG